MNKFCCLFITAWVTVVMLLSCKSPNEDLPYLGQTTQADGKTVHHKVGNFSHYNQDSVLVTNKSLADKVIVADFFFTSCPSICPKVIREMMKIQEAFKDEPMVTFLSFTIDPKRDDVARLKLYADNLGIDQSRWYFLTGDKDATFDLANTFFVAAFEDKDAPGGFDHSGKIILVDKEGHVRSFSEGTDPSTTPKLINDIRRLVDLYKENKK